MNPALANPGLTSPAGLTPGGLGSPTLAPNELPIDSQTGLDPGAGGTYPVLGDPSTFGGGAPAATGSGGGGGLVNDMMQAANQLGAGQAIDLLKGLVMPAITQGIQQGATGAPGAAALPLPGAAGALPGAAGALPGAAGALPGAAGALPGAAGAAAPAAAGALSGAHPASPAGGALTGAAAPVGTVPPATPLPH